MCCHLPRSCTCPWAAPPAMTQRSDRHPGDWVHHGQRVWRWGLFIKHPDVSLCVQLTTALQRSPREYQPFSDVPGTVRVPMWKWYGSCHYEVHRRTGQHEKILNRSPAESTVTTGLVPWGVSASFVFEVVAGLSLKWQRGSWWLICGVWGCCGRVGVGTKGQVLQGWDSMAGVKSQEDIRLLGRTEWCPIALSQSDSCQCIDTVCRQSSP